MKSWGCQTSNVCQVEKEREKSLEEIKSGLSLMRQATIAQESRTARVILGR